MLENEGLRRRLSAADARLNHAEQNAQAFQELRRVFEGLQKDLENERMTHSITKQSLDHEFSRHAASEKQIELLRVQVMTLLQLVNQIDMSKVPTDDHLPTNYKIGDMLMQLDTEKLETKRFKEENDALREKNQMLETQQFDKQNAKDDFEGLNQRYQKQIVDLQERERAVGEASKASAENAFRLTLPPKNKKRRT